MRLLCLVLISGLATAAAANAWNLRPWDAEMSRDDVHARIVGATVQFMDGGASVYSEDGSYTYTYEGGRVYPGTYRIEEDGSICIAFDNGPERCDLYVLHGDRLVMIAETGRRFPTKP